MSYPNPFQQTTQLLQSTGEGGLEERLVLYQVFQRLYEHNSALLNDLLTLEDSPASPGGAQPRYVIGGRQGHAPCLTTNLLGSPSQTLFQPDNIWIFGRALDAGLCLGDARLSRYHAAIQFISGQGFELLDLGSTNGSFVNGEAIRHRHPLNEGDRIRLGSITIYFFEQPEARRLPSIPAALRSQFEQIPSSPTPAKTVVQTASQGNAPPANDETMTFLATEEISSAEAGRSAGTDHRDRQARLLHRLRKTPEA